MDLQEARAAFLADKPLLIEKGIAWHPSVEPYAYLPSGDLRLAMDALPTLVTDPNAGIPTMLTTFIDPEVFNIAFAPLMAAEIIGDERKRGDWTEQTAMFPVTESVGEVKTYGDFDDGGGESNVNANWPNRQSYLFQSNIEIGELELDRYALARINLLGEKQAARARNLNTFMNFMYFFGVSGQQNYGLLNDPNLSAALAPAPKAYGGTAWISGGQVRASANEVYSDIQAVFIALVAQTAGLVTQDSEMTLALSPTSATALTATNSFNVNVEDLLKKNFSKLTIKKAVQYGVASASNPQGITAGNFMQLIAKEVQGQRTGFCAFNEKMRSHRIVYKTSSYAQKCTSGGWGTIIRFPAGIASMIGI